MRQEDVAALCGGLALFLCGMRQMSDGVGAVAGLRLRRLLAAVNRNRFTGVLFGTAVTALLQSSSAVTVMTVGLVDAGVLSLRQAVWLVMGANIGTTVTGQLTAAGFGAIAPFLALFGVLAASCAGQRANGPGTAVAGLGILMIGMEMMSGAMLPLGKSEAVLRRLSRLGHPLRGVLAGAAFAAVIQSSSAAVGILQALAASGAVPFASAVYLLFGQNIGTCATALLASAGMGRDAQRVTAVHILFNVTGTVLFVTLCQLTPFLALVARITPGRPAAQIANMHLIFNLATAILLLPAGELFARLAEWLVPDPRPGKLGRLR